MSLGENLANKYTDKKIINEDNTKIYAYLFDAILSSLSYDFFALTIGFITNKINCAILSYSCFIFYIITICK